MMMGACIKKTLSLILISLTLLSVLTITSCNRKYDEEEVLSNATKLLHRAEMLNEVYYGRGIQYISSAYQDGYYCEADPMHLSTLGFTTIRELENLTLETFTVGYSEEIFSTKLSMIEDEDGIREMTRYFQRYDDEKMTEPVCIMVYTKAPVLKKGSIVYDYSTLRVTGVKKQTVYVSVTAIVSDDDGNSQTTNIILNLIEEDNGWRIDNPCYANYSSVKDKYNELNK